ncbi:hypothetical protein PENSPDRAFT_654704 [Peniophora sp. CONT]|nr:hypothetical protein PENSPDRAFT_654704 [Peniophora sp. CONT]
MTAVDPTYPFYPIASFLSAVLLSLIVFSGLVLQRWNLNLGVAFLCFWLFFENLANAIMTIVWADNADIKLYVLCDIVSHLQIITSVVKPMSTFIITRRLYLVTGLPSVQTPDRAMRLRNLAIEWTLGLVIPVLIAGPFYYIVQQLRFKVAEGFGCNNASDGSILAIMLLNSWSVIPPLISVVFYYPRVARFFWDQSMDNGRFRQNDQSSARTGHLRLLVLASIDLLLTLPFGIVSIVLIVTEVLSQGPLPFYFGWTYDHTNWEPEGFSYADIVATGTSGIAQQYFSEWTSPVLSFAIFALFGTTSEARASYRGAICTVGSWFGWRSTPRTHTARPTQDTFEFGERPQEMSCDYDFSRSHPVSASRGPLEAELSGARTQEPKENV